MTREIVVVDSSVGVKWFRNEPGSEEARELVSGHIAGRRVLAVCSLFHYEVSSAASRGSVPIDALRVWRDLAALDPIVVPLGEELLAAAVAVRTAFGCSLYDAFAAGLADLLEAPLYSADVRAHGSHPRSRIIASG